MLFIRLSLLVVAVSTVGTSVYPLYAELVCVGCPTPKKTRITDGKWQTATQLGDGVKKTDAELLVRGARRNEIADRPVNEKQTNWPPLDIGVVYQIGDASSYFAGPNPWLGPAESHVQYFFLAVPGSKGTSGAHVVSVRSRRVERVAYFELIA